MAVVEITNVLPFDVLLISGNATSSKINKSAQWIARRGRAAPYSHAAMFLSPFLLLEALDTPGIVLKNLFHTDIDPSGEEAENASNRRGIAARVDNSRIRLFAILPGVDAAEIRRYAPIRHDDTRSISMSMRHVIRIIGDVYVAQYPAYARLARTTRLFPDAVMQMLERWGGRLQGKGITGPFCSELVVILLSTINQAILREFGKPEEVMPSDLAYAPSLFSLVEKSEKGTANQLPGEPVEGITKLLERSLGRADLSSQSFRSELLQLSPKLPAINKSLYQMDEDDFEKETKRVEAAMESVRREWLEPVDEHIMDGFIFSRWLQDANKCAMTCPINRSEPKRAPYGLKIAWEFDGPSEMKCSDIRHCSAISRKWSEWTTKLEQNLERRLDRDVNRASEKIRKWNGHNS